MRPRVSLRVLLSLVLGSWGAEAVQVGSRCGVGVACRARPLRLSTSEQPVWEGQPTAETDTSAAAGVPIPFRPLDRQEVVDRLDGAFAVLVEILDRHGGIVNKFLGDGFLALFGAAMQDRKKRAALGERWADWQAKTSFVPFATGRVWPGWIAVVGGALLFLVATWAHPRLGAPIVGPWSY